MHMQLFGGAQQPRSIRPRAAERAKAEVERYNRIDGKLFNVTNQISAVQSYPAIVMTEITEVVPIDYQAHVLRHWVLYR